jgi:tagaturonate reductase
MKLRNIPVLLKHFEKIDNTPAHMALGFAAWLLFMKSEKNEKGQIVGNWNQNEYVIQDEHAAYFYEKWKRHDTESLVEDVLGDKGFWGTDLLLLNGFANAVKTGLASLMKSGVEDTLRQLESERIFV